MKKRKKRPAKQVAKMKNGASIVFGRMRLGSKDYESALRLLRDAYAREQKLARRPAQKMRG